MMIAGPARILYDENGNPVTVQAEGANHLLGVHDPIVAGLLVDLLKEVRLTRMMLTEALDASLKIEDIE